MKGWAHLIASMIAMIMIANLQYSWALFVKPKGLLIFCAAEFLKNPEPNDPEIAGKKATSRFKLRSHAEQFTSFEMLRTPQFYVLYAMMLMMRIGGLLVTAQVGSVADTLGISKIAFTPALTINPLANGSGRIFGGWVSDHMAFGLIAMPLATKRHQASPVAPAVKSVSLDGWLARI
jgi:OFA family oxalate/formate antiporter-like MFS transporter